MEWTVLVSNWRNGLLSEKDLWWYIVIWCEGFLMMHCLIDDFLYNFDLIDFNPFVPNAPFLYLLKIAESRKDDVFRG